MASICLGLNDLRWLDVVTSQLTHTSQGYFTETSQSYDLARDNEATF